MLLAAWTRPRASSRLLQSAARGELPDSGEVSQVPLFWIVSEMQCYMCGDCGGNGKSTSYKHKSRRGPLSVDPAPYVLRRQTQPRQASGLALPCALHMAVSWPVARLHNKLYIISHVPRLTLSTAAPTHSLVIEQQHDRGQSQGRGPCRPVSR